MHKFLEVRVHKSFFHEICHAEEKIFRINLLTDQDLRNPSIDSQIVSMVAGNRIAAIAFDSLADPLHINLVSGAGYFEGQNHVYISITVRDTARVVISSYSLTNIIMALDRIKNGETPDFWRPDYGYSLPVSISCAYGNEPIPQYHPFTEVDYDWWGPHI